VELSALAGVASQERASHPISFDELAAQALFLQNDES
jgi:hypothetical protein